MTMIAKLITPIRRRLSIIANVNSTLALGIALLATIILLALVSIVYTPYPPNGTSVESASAPISLAHLLGGDYLGRDILSRLMTGAAIASTISLTTITVASIVAFVLSIISVASTNSATRRGQIPSRAIAFFTNTLMGIPSLLIALAVVTALGGGTTNTIIAITIMLIPGLTRVMQGAILEVYGEDYIKVAKTWGVSPTGIALRHVLPNAAPTVIVAIPIYMSSSILVEAGLSYLGLGVTPPTPTWGLMLNESIAHLNTQPVAALAPASAIVVTILGLNLTSDGLNKALNRKQ